MGCIFSSSQVLKYQTRHPILQIGSQKIIKQNPIAQGAYGQVWKCLQPQTNKIYGLKQIKLQTKQLSAMFEKQVNVLTIMKANGSKHVVKLLQSAKYSSQESGQYPVGYLLMEFSHMSLYEEVSIMLIYEQIVNKRFSHKQIVKVLMQILSGLIQLHSANIYHLDIKPENIILCQNQYKICDLGSSIYGKVDFNKLQKRQRLRIQQFIQSNSTLMYRSPQMVDLSGKVLDQKSDIWMLGLIGYMMVYRKNPFENKGKTAILSPIQFPTAGHLEQVLKKMLQIDTERRLSGKAVQQELERLYQVI